MDSCATLQHTQPVCCPSRRAPVSSVPIARARRVEGVRVCSVNKVVAQQAPCTNGGAGFIRGQRQLKSLTEALTFARKQVSRTSGQALTTVDCPSVLSGLDAELQAMQMHIEESAAAGRAQEVPNLDRTGSMGGGASSGGHPAVQQQHGVGAAAAWQQGVAETQAIVDPTLPQFAPRHYACAASVRVCQGSKCSARGSCVVLAAAEALLAGSNGVSLAPARCMGKCNSGPAARVVSAGRIDEPRGALLTRLSPSQLGAQLDNLLS